MSELISAEFTDFFKSIYGRDANPYPWQCRLAVKACEGNWPGAIDLPTGSGKTSCIDIAVFAMACQAARDAVNRTAPRRIFFCVNRRVIVDEAYYRSLHIALKIREAKDGILRRVADDLHMLAGTTREDNTPPLDVLELRGGVYRDNRWTRSATQPTIVCTTIDQLGSRLLFRGYGVSPNAAPIQASLIAYDSLVLLDEAHISEPFRQTLEQVKAYLDPKRWAEQHVGLRPVIFVPMTATPPPSVALGDVTHLKDDDRNTDGLRQRLAAEKQAELKPVMDIVKAAVVQASERASTPVAMGIIVNRVATAKAIYQQLIEKHPDVKVELVIGSMRPVDRDKQAKQFAELVGAVRPKVSNQPSIIVATQCLEVGADYDFDILISECASLDSLRQRFGRLNRAGRAISASAIILINIKDIKADDSLDDEKPLDPIYGNALARTWNWLWSHATASPTVVDVKATTAKPKKNEAAQERRTIDFGIDAFTEILKHHGKDGRVPKDLLAPSASMNAPVMLPAYLDLWCQTSPIPTPDPDLSLFLHGRQSSEPDIQVCWRADLLTEDTARNMDIIALLPPITAECMSVPISRIRRWLANQMEFAHGDGDLLERSDIAEPNEPRKVDHDHQDRGRNITGVLWRGVKNSEILRLSGDLCPGDTLVLPTVVGGWDELGHIPPSSPQNQDSSGDEVEETSSTSRAPRIDVAEDAFYTARGRVALRVHPNLKAYYPQGNESFTELWNSFSDQEDLPTLEKIRELLSNAAESLTAGHEKLKERLECLSNKDYGLILESYPDRQGVVLISRKTVKPGLPALDEGDDELSRINRKSPVTLEAHTLHVKEEIEKTLKLASPALANELFVTAAGLHDLGKADDRFQAWLRGSDRTQAYLHTDSRLRHLAKSSDMAQTPSDRKKARVRAGLPEGYRHEMLSVQLAERSDKLPTEPTDRDLILHLIEAHHGFARPFAPVVLDEDSPDVEIDGIHLFSQERSETPPHRIDSGVGERFWTLTRRYGWWGLAYLETLLRLADQKASANEDEGKYTDSCKSAEKENQ